MVLKVKEINLFIKWKYLFSLLDSKSNVWFENDIATLIYWDLFTRVWCTIIQLNEIARFNSAIRIVWGSNRLWLESLFPTFKTSSTIEYTISTSTVIGRDRLYRLNFKTLLTVIPKLHWTKECLYSQGCVGKAYFSNKVRLSLLLSGLF